jgi:hypothetical protein
MFLEQLGFALQHIADNGVIFFNQMLVGSDAGEELRIVVTSLCEDRSFQIEYAYILEPLSSHDFLTGVYGDRHPNFQRMFVNQYPYMLLCVGVINSLGSGNTTVKEVPLNFDLHGRSWADRIAAHWELAQHEFR